MVNMWSKIHRANYLTKWFVTILQPDKSKLYDAKLSKKYLVSRPQTVPTRC